MISKYDMIEHLKKNQDKFMFYYDEKTDGIHNKETGEYKYPFDNFLNAYKKNNGESFDCIYDEHVSCMSVLRCTECGTVVFYHYDEDYEPNFKCPICTDYKTWYTYWTKSDIEADPSMKAAIDMYTRMAKSEADQYAREKKRHGKHDDQLCIFEKKTKTRLYKIELKCNDIVKSYVKGLRIKITRWTTDVEHNCRIYDKEYRIPLGITALCFDIKRYKNRKNKYTKEYTN